MRVRARDAAGNWSAQSTALSVTTIQAGTGNVTQETWTNVIGTTLANIPTSTAPNTTAILTSLEIPVNVADNYGVRIRGFIIPSTTGNYNFYIASDNVGQFSLSTTNSPKNAIVIASVPDWTDSRQWNKFSSQQSAVKSLTAGVKYYFEALMKEVEGGDNLAIGWTGPGISAITVIGAANLDVYVASIQAGVQETEIIKLQEEVKQISVYPNPATTSFNVSTPSSSAKIIVTALNGKVIKTVNANAKVTTIESGNWAAGMYIIQIQTEAQTTIKKVVIAK
jgi:hypothetical protein